MYIIRSNGRGTFGQKGFDNEKSCWCFSFASVPGLSASGLSSSIEFGCCSVFIASVTQQF